MNSTIGSLGLVTFVLLSACAGRQPPPREARATTTSAALAAEAPPEPAACEVECDGASVVSKSVRIDAPDYHAAAVANANHVVASLHDDLLACYRKRLTVNPRARGLVTLDIVVEETGRVRRVEPTGGATLGDGTVQCLAKRMERATFAPVRGGGTLRLQVPLTFRLLGPGESI